MPEKGALDEATRTLILLGIALATGSESGVKAMAPGPRVWASPRKPFCRP